MNDTLRAQVDARTFTLEHPEEITGLILKTARGMLVDETESGEYNKAFVAELYEQVSFTEAIRTGQLDKWNQ